MILFNLKINFYFVGELQQIMFEFICIKKYLDVLFFISY